MLSFTVIGCGAAGNKAVIDLMGIGYNPSKCYLVNSTAKDIPSDYHDNMIIFGASSNRLGGCGKERSIGREMLLTDLKAGKLDLDALVDPNDQAIVLVGSTEGGSGSSSIPILAKYFKQVHGKNVICVFFFGFNDDCSFVFARLFGQVDSKGLAVSLIGAASCGIAAAVDGYVYRSQVVYVKGKCICGRIPRYG